MEKSKIKFFEKKHIEKNCHPDISKFADYSLKRIEHLKKHHENNPCIVKKSDFKLKYTPKNTLKTTPFQKDKKLSAPLKLFINPKSKDLSDKIKIAHPKSIQKLNAPTSNSLPTNFSWKDQNPTWLLPVMDQGQCGSCYACSAAMMFSDRLSIKSSGSTKLMLSPMDIVICGNNFVNDFLTNSNTQSTVQDLISKGTLTASEYYTLQGCDGGMLASVVDYIVELGLPADSIVPYQYTPGVNTNDPSFNLEKQGNYYSVRNTTLQNYYGSNAYSLVMGIEQSFPDGPVTIDPSTLQFNNENTMQGIFTDGPVIAGFDVYTDFYYYPANGEIYSKSNTLIVNGQNIPVNYEGGHAIVILGWGEQQVNGQTVKYWYCQNSWGTEWGIDGGYFKIERGVNMCNIEFDIMAANPDLTKAPMLASQQENSFIVNTATTTPSTTTLNALWITLLVIFAVFAVLFVILGIVFLMRYHRSWYKHMMRKTFPNQQEMDFSTQNFY